eukprot:c25771_g1_i1.p1 GENE.c25771_g1_i1~~c25771_g1_i1.p1  ORF type:complete len:545 (+),score=109.48 c25771_g1_i1:153-1637(+)
MSVPSPIFNRHIGKQFFDPLAAPGAFLGHKNVCKMPKTNLRLLCQGKVAFFIRTSADFWDLETEAQNVACLQDAGAVGVVIAYPLYYEPGLGARVSAASRIRNNNPDSSIPVLHIVTNDVPQVVLERIRSSLVTVELTQTPNQYEELWTSKTFSSLWRVLLPVLNGGGMLLGMLAIASLLSNVLSARGRERKIRFDHSFWLIAGYSLLTLTCTIRFFYCTVGPFYSCLLPGFTMDYHMIMLNLTILFETITSMIAVALFRRWAEFGMSTRALKVHKALAVLAIAALCVCLIVTVMHVTHTTNVMYLGKIVKPALLVTLSSIVNLVTAQRLIAVVLPQAFCNPKLTKHRHKFVRITVMMIMSGWMSGVVLVTLIVVTAVQGRPMYSLHGHYVTYSIIYVGVTLQSITHMMALYPSTRTLRVSTMNVVPARKQSCATQSCKEPSDRSIEGRQQSKYLGSAQPEVCWMVYEDEVDTKAAPVGDVSEEVTLSPEDFVL